MDACIDPLQIRPRNQQNKKSPGRPVQQHQLAAAEHHIQPEGQAEPARIAAGWARAAETQRSFGRDFAAGPAGFGRRSCWAPCSLRSGFVPGADVVAQALVGQRGVVVPLGGALVLGDAVQGVQGFLIKSAADVVGWRRAVRGFLASGVGLACPAGGAVILQTRTAPKPNPPVPPPTGAVLLVVAALLAVSLLAVAALGIAKLP